jgi:hypothetical protein
VGQITPLIPLALREEKYELNEQMDLPHRWRFMGGFKESHTE